MAANPASYGLIPVRTLDGDSEFPMTLRPTGNNVKGKNDQQIFPGDVVFLDASGGIQKYCDAASGKANPIPLGVVGQVFNSNKRPFTFNQPGAGPFLPVSAVGYAGVYENPDIIFRANASATANYQCVGQFVQIRVSAPSTAAGRSGMGIDVAAIGAQATAAGHVAKLYAISTQDGNLDETRVSGQANNDVEVILVNHQWRNPWLRNVAGVVDVSGLST